MSLSPGEGVPSLRARKILHIDLHTLCSALSHAVSLSQNQLGEMQREKIKKKNNVDGKTLHVSLSGLLIFINPAVEHRI